MPSLVAHDSSRRLWVLSGASSCYVLHLDEEDRLRSPHWGPQLTLEQASTLLDRPPPGYRAFEDPADGTLDLSDAGAMLFGHAGLQIRFADGTRDLELRFADHRVTDREDGAELALSFTDRHYPLTVEVRFRVRSDTEVMERRLVLRHTGTAGDDPIEVVRAHSATWVLPRLDDYRLSHVHGQWAAETQLHRTALAYGETLLSSRRGITSHQANPWVMIDDGTTAEEHGAVYSCALAWSGSWELTVQRLPTERVTVSAGAGHAPTVRRLDLGAELVTPYCAAAYTEGGFGAASRVWHHYQLAHVLPHPEEVRPVLYNSWEATEFDLSMAGQSLLAERAAALGVELFVMDDGWFGARTHDAAGLGDWDPNPDRFPDGLKPLIAKVHSLGMRFGIWVEPEMVNPDSDLYRAHPDWVLHQPHRRRTEHRNQLVLNLARPDVAHWLHDRMNRLLAENAVDFVKWDMNRPVTEAGWPDAGPDPERLWLDHTRNLYAVLDRLRADHPDVRFEACSGGGGRLDLGILARTDQVWTSDNTDARDRLTIQHGFSQLYPARVMGTWVTDSPNPLTKRRIPLAFRFHVAMAGVLAIGGDLARWSEAELTRAGELVRDYQEIRPLVQHGLQFRLRPPGGDLGGIQYVDAGGSATAVLAFRCSAHLAQPDRPLPLRGLDPAARYRDAASGESHHGAVLLTHGLPLALPPEDYASRMVHLLREA
ncbi:alpha-galactosidase [Streptomyces sp. RKAG293]|uniref:alpha-galactosidase n=1 Tax=Streptomyces sp. RKAG293 TaxID=2893403 RepID=UPI002033DBC6|nr:alpha-galactosidase [Streptomyces sp. RKAG293]MCM2423242.1 alpha-galactosidase [Streptomyces sp. RKAG293]